jgi:hypothetical protein
MMMKCLHHGGLNAVYDPALDSAYASSVNSLNGYHPNPFGYYESQVNVKARGFIQNHRDKLVKVLQWQVQDLPKYRYHVVLMRRHPVEVDMSMRRVGQGQGQTPRLYQGCQDRIQIILESRSDVNLNVLDYADVVSNPNAAFKSLTDNGFPINPELAAAVVDERLYR